jgi:hypothetical protein
MVGNALLRGGTQINFWQSKSGARQDVHPLLINHAKHLSFWSCKKASVEQQTLV